MKGCLGCFKLVQTIISIIVLSLIGFIILIPCGGLDYIKNYMESKKHPQQEVSIQTQAQKLGDFSKMPKEYSITRVVNMMGASAVVAQDKKTEQKMLVINPGWLLNMSKEDIDANTVDTELRKLSEKLNNPSVKLSALEVGKKGTFKAFDQNVPYVNLKVGVTGTANKSMEGIIGVVSDPKGKNKLIVSMNDIGKYKENVAEKYFKSIELQTRVGENPNFLEKLGFPLPDLGKVKGRSGGEEPAQQP